MMRILMYPNKLMEQDEIIPERIHYSFKIYSKVNKKELFCDTIK